MAKKKKAGSKKPPPSAVASYITSIGEDDVVLGRGAPVLKLTGNQRFRQLVAVDKAEYKASGRHAVKEEIAERIYNTITVERGGKFLRRVESKKEKRQLGISAVQSEAAVWVVVDKDTAYTKIKQALREQQPSTSRASPGELQRKSTSKQERQRKSRPSSASQESAPSSSTVSTSAVAAMPQPEANVAASDGRQSSVPSSSEEQSDLEFRLKHPSLRKRDLLRMRREQRMQQQGLAGAASMPPSSPESRTQRASREEDTDDDESDSDDDRKPRAKR